MSPPFWQMTKSNCVPIDFVNVCMYVEVTNSCSFLVSKEEHNNFHVNY